MVNVFQYSSGCTTFEGWDDCDLSALVWLEALIEPSDGCWIVAMAVRERQRAQGGKRAEGGCKNAKGCNSGCHRSEMRG
jgi:hypothetical protein